MAEFVFGSELEAILDAFLFLTERGETRGGAGRVARLPAELRLSVFAQICAVRCKVNKRDYFALDGFYFFLYFLYLAFFVCLFLNCE